MATLKELDGRFRDRGPLLERFRAARQKLVDTTLAGTPNQAEAAWADAIRASDGYQVALDKDYRIFVNTTLVNNATDLIAESGPGAITDAQIETELAALLSTFVA